MRVGRVHCHSFIDEVTNSKGAAEQLFVWCLLLVFAATKMSRNALQNSYFNATENIENCEGVKLRVKDGEARETMMQVQGKRTVLGTLTNKPFSNVAVKSKQVQTTFAFLF